MEFFKTIFDAEALSEEEIEGYPFIRLNVGGAVVILSGLTVGSPDLLPTEGKSVRGLDHRGLRVDDLDAAAAELKTKAQTSPWSPPKSVLESRTLLSTAPRTSR